MRCIFLCAFRASRSLGSRRLSLHRSLVHWRSAGTMGEKTSHLERTAREPRERELIDVKLSQVKQVNDQVRLLRLSLPAPIKVLAGQWLDTYVPNTRGAGGFTITSSPSTAASPQDPYFELAVQKSPDNPHAAWIWQPPEEILNHRLQVRVGGSFVYPPGADFEDVKRVVLVGGGVGVNPLVSMMGEMADRRDDLEVDVLYGSKLPGGTLHEVLFLDRIAQMFRGGRLKGSVNVFLTETGDSTLGEIPEWLQSPSIALRKGRMSVQQVKNAISKGDSNETIVYICGPPAMTDGLAAAVSQQDDGVIEARRVMTEKWW